MQTLIVIIVILAALVTLVPLIFMVLALFRSVVESFRSPNLAPSGSARPKDDDGVVDTLAWTPRRHEVTNADERESVEP